MFGFEIRLRIVIYGARERATFETAAVLVRGGGQKGMSEEAEEDGKKSNIKRAARVRLW